jgi:hypothetical protein
MLVMSQYQSRLSSITNVAPGSSANHIAVFTSNKLFYYKQLPIYLLFLLWGTNILYCIYIINIVIHNLFEIHKVIFVPVGTHVTTESTSQIETKEYNKVDWFSIELLDIFITEIDSS